MTEATSDASGEGPPPVEGEVLRWRKNDKPDGEWRAVSHPYQCWVEDRSGGLARTWAAKIGIEAKTRLATALVEAREHIDDLEGDLAMIQPDDAWDEVTKLSEGIGIPLDKSHYGVLCGSHTLADVIGCVARNARECIAALESEVGAARGLLDRVATTEIPLCSGEHGKACDCVGDAVRAHLAAGWTTERRNGEAIPAERIAELLRCLDAEAAFARDAGRSADGFEVGDFERDPWTTMTHDELHSLLVAAQPAAPPAGEAWRGRGGGASVLAGHGRRGAGDRGAVAARRAGGGVSNAWPGEWCKRCKRRNVVGFVVDDEKWAAVVVSRGNKWGVLCPVCFDEEAFSAGVAYEFKALFPVTWSQWAEADAESDEALLRRLNLRLKPHGLEAVISGTGSNKIAAGPDRTEVIAQTGGD